MRKIVTAGLSIIVVTVTTGFILSRSVGAMAVKMHRKDLPEHGLTIIGPSDPSFDTLWKAHFRREPKGGADNWRAFSFFLENRSKQTVVAYTIQSCLTKPDGNNECFIQSVTNPRALMDGDNLSEEMVEQSGRIKPNSARFFSLVSPDGSGAFRVPASPEEAEQLKGGARPDGKVLLQRYAEALSKYSDITVSIDGAFFADGTFVGPDTTGFFDETQAQISAKYDVLNKIAEKMSKSGESSATVFRDLEEMANQPEASIDSKSTPSDYYNYHQKHFADEILRSRNVLGDEKALAAALRPMKKPWRLLRKKQSLK